MELGHVKVLGVLSHTSHTNGRNARNSGSTGPGFTLRISSGPLASRIPALSPKSSPAIAKPFSLEAEQFRVGKTTRGSRRQQRAHLPRPSAPTTRDDHHRFPQATSQTAHLYVNELAMRRLSASELLLIRLEAGSEPTLCRSSVFWNDAGHHRGPIEERRNGGVEKRIL